MLAFAARYPDEVAGMVLVDSTAPAPDTSPPNGAASYDLMGRVSALLSASARLGLGRLHGLFSYGSLPPQSRDEARASMATASQVGSTVDEYAEATSSMDEAQSLRDFDAKPLIVLTAGRRHYAEWPSAQDDLATLSTNNLHRVLAEATHASAVVAVEGVALLGFACWLRLRGTSEDPRP